MSQTMKVQPFDVLLRWIIKEYREKQSIFGIHKSLFYTPAKDSPYGAKIFGEYLAAPLGPAAGPHTQLAQNIVCAWLSGGRFIELKTVQIMDELEISRPCIDMEDEGYNVEWSQELKLDQSALEYIKGWVLIHILHRLLGYEEKTPLGTIFNMSVGYNLEGIKSAPMTRFMDRMADASAEISQIRAVLTAEFPPYANLEIPSRLTNNVTLSTMHGCPPEEIERIARYLLVERGLHTIVKLNPTLLGQERVLGILHHDLGYAEINIPDSVFEHDIKYDRAVEMIKRLQDTAASQNLTLGVKLSNTLAMANHRGLLPGDEMYMSGRALYPITMNLFHQLTREFNGELKVSFSAGADAFNVTDILASGALPVTCASDLLKPGGYSRLRQYLENLKENMALRGAASLDELRGNKLANLEQAAAEALKNLRYKKDYHPYGLPKVGSGLGLFDCITAPCMEQCPVCQDVPQYARLIARGDYDGALEVILAQNPLPAVNGYICTHLCQTRCTRNNYDEPVAIRALKRFAAEKGSVSRPVKEKVNRRVAVIGAGPSGLAAASLLALKGVQVTIYEAKDRAGGMPALAPAFRIPPAMVQEDVDRIKDLGVEILLSHPVTAPPEALLKQGFDAVYVACGFPQDAPLNIGGIEGKGVFTALDLLERVARGEKPDLGSKVLVIGGGNTAMDAARTARRLSGRPVTVIYRRTRKEMPAAREEIEELFVEDNLLEELVSPQRVILRNGRVAGLACIRNKLGEPDAGGRGRPMEIPGSEFEIVADSVIIAVGQSPNPAFLRESGITVRKGGAIDVDQLTGLAGVPCVYAGGDAVRGPAIVIQACADGQRAAESICREFGLDLTPQTSGYQELSDEEIRQVKRVRARKEAQHNPLTIIPSQRNIFETVEQTLTEEEARREAARCMLCSSVCDKCVDVCPNRANYTYFIPAMSVAIPRLSCHEGDLMVVAETEVYRVSQTRQIIHLDDFCNECGNCAIFCLHQGKPYREKPRLFLQEEDFNKESDNAYYIAGETIRRRQGSQESRLSLEKGSLIFENSCFCITLDLDYAIKKMTLKKAFRGTYSLTEVLDMALILKGVKNSLPFLLEASIAD